MYDIRNLNIWKEDSSYNLFFNTDRVLEAEVSRRKEIKMSEKCQAVFDEILMLVPTREFSEIKRRRGNKLRFPIYMNEKLKTTEIDALDLSARSSNCLHRAGYEMIGELVEAIESSEDLRKIRNCGTKSIDEIMEKLFCYQYNQLDMSQKMKYIKRVIELN